MQRTLEIDAYPAARGPPKNLFKGWKALLSLFDCWLLFSLLFLAACLFLDLAIRLLSIEKGKKEREEGKERKGKK